MTRVSSMLKVIRLIKLYKDSPSKVWRCTSRCLSDDFKPEGSSSKYYHPNIETENNSKDDLHLGGRESSDMSLSEANENTVNKNEELEEDVSSKQSIESFDADQVMKSKSFSHSELTTSSEDEVDLRTQFDAEPKIDQLYHDQESEESNKDNTTGLQQNDKPVFSNEFAIYSVSRMVQNLKKVAEELPVHAVSKENLDKFELETKRMTELFNVLYPKMQASQDTNESSDLKESPSEAAETNSPLVYNAWSNDDYAFGYDGLWESYPPSNQNTNQTTAMLNDSPSPTTELKLARSNPSPSPVAKETSIEILYEKLLEGAQANQLNASKVQLEDSTQVETPSQFKEFLRQYTEGKTTQEDIPIYKPFQTIEVPVETKPGTTEDQQAPKSALQTTLNEQYSRILMRYALLQALKDLESGCTNINTKITILNPPRKDQ